MNFEELGEILRHEREKKGLSIEVVMEATKISKTNIVAMEAGDRSALPHPVYAKGFVKSYARYLDLDADEMCMVVDREFQDQGDDLREHGYEVSPAAEKAFQEKEGPESRKKRVIWPILLVLVVALGIVSFIVFGMKSKDTQITTKAEVTTEQAEPKPAVDESAQEPLPTRADQEAVAPSVPDETVAPGDAKEATPDGAVPDAASAGAAAEKAPEAVGTATKQAEMAATKQAEIAAKKPVEAAARDTEVDEAEKTAAVPDKPKYDHVLIIRATTEKGCWVGVWRGNETKMARDFVLKEGEPLRLMFNHARRIRIGNASGVTVTYNGKPYSLDLKLGNIQTLTFGE